MTAGPNTLPPTEERFDPEKNIRTVIRHYYDEDGDLIKETNEFRTEKRIVTSQIARRKNLKKFGASTNDPPGGTSANTCLAEHVSMQIIQIRQSDAEQEKQEELDSKIKNRAPVFSCRHCKGAHFTHQCPNKNEMEKMQALQDRIKAKTEVVEETQNERPGHYIPPPLRGAGATHINTGSVSEKRPFDGNTVRVTNLPPDTTVDELKRLFSQFGRVMRIYPAKDKLTQQSRGFAFISYETADQAKEAINCVNGLRHNHVVLRVDWAKPSVN